MSERESRQVRLLVEENGQNGGGREGREGKGRGKGGWEREVSGDSVAVTPRLSCCSPESKP